MDAFLADWFSHPQWWFNASSRDDAYLTEQYEHLLDCLEDDHQPIAKLIILDQLPRHIFRNTASQHIILYYLRKALIFADALDQDYLTSLSDNEWCFAMLPHRHSMETSRIVNIVMKSAWQRLEHAKDKDVIRRFIKATYERCPVEDQSKMLHFYPVEDGDSVDLQSHASVLDDTRGKLENNRIKYDPSIWRNVKHICQQLLDRKTPTILSFSGGVDSMLCSHLIGNEFITVAVHINYCNRENTREEEAFVRFWCQRMRIPLYVRRIEEIKRKSCMENDMRDLYEAYTRNVRYNTYKTVHKYYNTPPQNKYDSFPRVILGHNKDDCLENIFTNIAQTSHYENLSGMSLLSIQDDIQFIRPLLSQTKLEIYEYVAHHEIPHLKSSTPNWSMRGQIRSKVTPVINDWDRRYVPGLFNLSSTISDLYKFMEMSVDTYVTHTVTRADGQYELRYDIPYHSTNFWRIYIQALLKEVISNKSLKHMMEKLESWDGSHVLNIVLKKTVAIQFHNRAYITISRGLSPRILA